MDAPKAEDQWRPRKLSAGNETGPAFAENSEAMTEALGRLTADEKNSKKAWRHCRKVARELSVYVRKFILDGLLERTIYRPRLDALKPESASRIIDVVDIRRGEDGKWVYVGGTMLRTIPGIEPGEKPGHVHLTSDIFTSGNRQMMAKGWMGQKVMRIKRVVAQEISVRDIIAHIANTEGAHPSDMKKNRDGKPNDMDSIRIDGMSYAHWFTICVAVYLHNRIQSGVEAYPKDWEEISIVKEDRKRMIVKGSGAVGLILDVRLDETTGEPQGDGYRTVIERPERRC